MTTLDWWIIGGYLFAMLVLAVYLGRPQQTEREYYLGGGLPAPALATSILATQCSTNSLLGAPAFVGFAAGGGLLWLQYELAVPLAMLGLAFLFPAVHRSGVISIYAFLEQRVGRGARLAASGCFLFFRGVATGVTVYGVASVLALITGIGYVPAVALLMGVTVTYDVMGGMRAVVVSDVLQMLLLVSAVILSLCWLAPDLWSHLDDLSQRSRPLMNDWGVSGTSNYGFWPMLFGGLFLYMAYYGCDQSQAQRLLAARSDKDLHKILMLNGLMRFPIVLAYCLLGLGLAAYALERPEFLSDLPLTASGAPNLNLVFPAFVLREFAPGLAGLAIVGLFAAAMSSIDSALNSLSASTLEDFFPAPDSASQRSRFVQSKLVTLCWGVFTVGFSFGVEHIASTLLESINKVGSLVNGPLLGLFTIAILLPGTSSRNAVAAFLCGVVANLLLWQLAPSISWLWWNLAGCLVTLAMAAMGSGPSALPRALQTLREANPPRSTRAALLAGFAVIMALLLITQGYM
ncbi:sodium:solute symporter [Congregibacter variabilis]|uniref:Sodium:solute symporter n=1 Tax=Congregibacter variabilis TaxID=3081200 RepID=A0ABZ0I4Q0_9GAMM|nr:sodium:solute symporter [Congregibacter sp. IMCC43200]